MNLIEFKNVNKSFKDKDILAEAKLLEDIKCLIHAIFDEIIVEQGQKLVIFVDDPGFVCAGLNINETYKQGYFVILI